ncbi:MAG: nuclear transport factor 2 family protein [Pseudomonadota bacterium]
MTDAPGTVPRTAATAVVHVDDDRFRVTEWQFAPGAETGWHRHGHDYVIVPLTDGCLGLELPDAGQAQAALTAGLPYSRRVGVEHNVINAGPAPLAFLEVEVVDDAQAHRRRQTLIRMMAAFNARDLDGVMACMAADCAFHASAGPTADGTRYIGPDAVRAAFQQVLDAFPLAQWTQGQHQVLGEVGLSTWRFVGRDAAGQAVDVQGCDLFSFAGDLIRLKDSFRKQHKPG